MITNPTALQPGIVFNEVCMSQMGLDPSELTRLCGCAAPGGLMTCHTPN